MAIDAVFPAASELVMVYAGALAAGAFTSVHHVSLFGAHFGSGWPAYLAVALAGTFGYLFGAIVGWAIGLYGGRPPLEGSRRPVPPAPPQPAPARCPFDHTRPLGVLSPPGSPHPAAVLSLLARAFCV